jgi:hypothetical protein
LPSRTRFWWQAPSQTGNPHGRARSSHEQKQLLRSEEELRQAFPADHAVKGGNEIRAREGTDEQAFPAWYRAP